MKFFPCWEKVWIKNGQKELEEFQRENIWEAPGINENMVGFNRSYLNIHSFKKKSYHEQKCGRSQAIKT